MTVRWCHNVSRFAVFALRSNILAPRQDVKLTGGNIGEGQWLSVVSSAQRLHLSATDGRRGGVRELRAVSIVIHNRSIPWPDPTAQFRREYLS